MLNAILRKLVIPPGKTFESTSFGVIFFSNRFLQSLVNNTDKNLVKLRFAINS